MARKTGADPLATYRAKRDFATTPEPAGDDAAPSTGGELVYVIQKHAATRLHYDFRLEWRGVMLSWAVPKGPSFDSRDKRMAVRTEDHPISYNSFEGTIPKGQYGAGQVLIWDRGTWHPVGDPDAGLEAGKLVFELRGQKLAGLWELVRIGKPGDRQMAWILFKKRDAYERPRSEYDVVSALPDSVVAKPLPPAWRAARPVAEAAADAPVAKRAADLAGAVKARPPATFQPQLATLATGVPAGHEWDYEIKFDGYRLLAHFDAKGQARLITRNGHDWSSRMKALHAALEALKLRDTWLDGEIVVLGANGLPDFNALQNAFDRAANTDPITYFVFDAPYVDGHDLRAVPLRQRRRFLQAMLAGCGDERVRFSAAFDADPTSILQSAQKLGLEGVIAKRADAPYVSSRTDTWLKLKTRQRQEFIVIGYTDRSDARGAREIGSLQLAVYDDAGGQLIPAGSVGTGWDSATAAGLKQLLAPLRTDAPPPALAAPLKRGRWTRREVDAVRWVEPVTVVEVNFAEWTPDQQIRHATFVGVREDKPASAIRRERAAALPGAVPLRTGAGASATKVSNPDRVVDPSTGLTKLDVVRYYESVGEWMLPHLKARPVSLVRAPSGIQGQLFFQKHDDKLSIGGLRQLDPALWPEHDALLEVPTAEAIAEAAQMNVIEFHTWNATAKKIDKPDRVVFDLDPGDGVAWKQVQEAAVLVRSLLTELGLQSWLKTSGGKGLHVFVPLTPRDGWDAVKDTSQAIVQHLARVIPSRFVAVSGPKNRVGRIFVDYLRNSHGATTAAAFSVRARPGLGVSMPVDWDELPALKSGAQYTVANAREALSFRTADPWADYWGCRQTLTQARKALGPPT
jgi:bifunctional non-homologous end joining protein LigD